MASVGQVARQIDRRAFGPPATEHSGVNSVVPGAAQAYGTWVLFGIGCAWALHFLAASRGVTTHDAIGHFVISREAWHRPVLLLHHWGRPLNTLLYMPAALFGLIYGRLTSLVMSASTILLTVRFAQQLDVEYAFAVPLLLWFQPWFANLSVQPSLTEIPFSLMLVLSAIFFLSNNWTLASIVIGLLPLARHEGIILVGLWFVACIVRKQWAQAVLAVVPIAGYAALYAMVFGQTPGGEMPIVPNPALLGPPHLNLLHFPKDLVLGVGLPVASLVFYALPLLIRSAPRLAVVAWYGVYMGSHMAAYGLGYVASGGDERYLFPMAPIAAVAAALGLGAFVGEVRNSVERLSNMRIRGERVGQVLLIAGLLIVLAAGLRAKPVPLDAHAVAAREAAEWLRENRLSDGLVVSTSVYFHYFLPGHLDRYHRGSDPEELFSWRSPSELPPGTVAVWDSHYSEHSSIPYRALIADPHWTMLKRFDVTIKDTSDDDAHFVIFRKHGP